MFFDPYTQINADLRKILKNIVFEILDRIDRIYKRKEDLGFQTLMNSYKMGSFGNFLAFSSRPQMGSFGKTALRGQTSDFRLQISVLSPEQNGFVW
jgi:hypothetical protein